MTITQTVDITDDYRVILDVPRNVPKGRTDITILFPVKEEAQPSKPVPKDNNGEIRLSKKELDEMVKDSPILQKLSGILHTDMTIDEIRMERLAKHL